MTAYVTKTFKELPETAAHMAPANGIGKSNVVTDSAAAAEGEVQQVRDGDSEGDGAWLKDFRNLVSGLELTSHNVTSLLAIISGAIVTGRPLPPYLKVPERYNIGEMLTALDADILSTKHICEPGYSAFAVMQVSTTMLSEDLAGLLADTKRLVGEAEFNLDVVQGDYEKRVGVETVPSGGREKRD